MDITIRAFETNNHQLADCVIVILDELDEMGRRKDGHHI